MIRCAIARNRVFSTNASCGSTYAASAVPASLAEIILRINACGHTVMTSHVALFDRKHHGEVLAPAGFDARKLPLGKYG
jgi:hypothetical protein